MSITGASGAIGTAAVERLRQHEDIDLVCIDRAAWDVSAAVPGPVADRIVRSDVLLHMAADTRLGGPPAEVDAVNRGSVDTLTHLLAAPRSPRLIYVSSAFVAGATEQATNAYEESKRAAEELVRTRLPASVIVRPSIVMGAADSGRLERFGGFYTFLRMFVRKMVPALVADRDAQLDFVPVDAVADALVRATRDHADWAGATLGVTAGRESPSIGELAETLRRCVSDYAGDDFPAVPIVDPATYWRLYRPLLLPHISSRQRRLLAFCEVFMPYLASGQTFAETPGGVSLPVGERRALVDVFDKSVRFWLRATTPRVPAGSGMWRQASVSGAA